MCDIADKLGIDTRSIVRATAIYKEEGLEALCAMKDRCRALLAKTALEHTADLSMMEQQAEEMSPGNAEEFREIVRAYVAGAADQLRR